MADTIISAGHFHTFHRTAPFIAKEKGFWKEEGLEDAWFIATGEDESTIIGLELDSIQIALDTKPSVVFRENNKGHEVYVIGSMINTVPMIIVGAKGIRSVKELKGKPIGVKERGGAIELALYKGLLARNGLSYDKDVIHITKLGYVTFDNIAPRLGKEFYAVAMQAIYKDQVVKEGFPILGDITEVFPNGYPLRVMVANGRYIREQPDSLKAFLRAQLRAYRFLSDKKNLAEVLRLVKGRDWEKGKGWGWDEGFDPKIMDTGYMYTLLPPDGMPTGLDVAISEEKASGTLPPSFKLEQVTRLNFVQEAAKEVDKKYGPGGYERS